jgi:hypothetical protein
MTAPADRIDNDTLTALVNARPERPCKAALDAALNGINRAERTMREKTAPLRAALDEAEARLDAGLGWRADSRLIANAAADFDRANVTRNFCWATAAALLTEDEFSELTSATTPAPGK